MPREISHDDPKTHHANPSGPTTNGRSFFVTLSARALSSLGLGLSILAIWFRWFLPSFIATTPEAAPTKPIEKYRRRSAPPLPPPPQVTVLLPIRRVTAPAIPSPHEDMVPNRQRRVYFLDSPLPVIKSQEVISEKIYSEPLSYDTTDIRTNEMATTSTSRPRPFDSPHSSFSSLSTLVNNSSSLVEHHSNPDTPEEFVDSDSSSRRSSLSIHLSKMKNPFAAKSRRLSRIEAISNDPAETSLAMRSDNIQPPRKSSITSLVPRPLGRSHTVTGTMIDDDSSQSAPASRLSFCRPSGSKPPTCIPPASASSSTSYFLRKAQKRPSTSIPVPRTSPYEAPYFAAPPIPFDANYPTYLKGLPRFGDDMNLKSIRNRAASGQENTTPLESARGREPRQSNVAAQAALGHGRPKALAKRRSASESWANDRQAIQL